MMHINDHAWIVACLRDMLAAYEAEGDSPDFHLMIVREYRRKADGLGMTLKLGVSSIERDRDDC